MTAIQLAQRATGLLRTFNTAGVLSAADVHVAVRLGRLGREESEVVLFAAALAVRAVRSGSVCLELLRMHEIGIDGEGFDTGGDPEAIDPATLPWPDVDAVLAALRVSPLVQGSPAGPLRPLRLVDHDTGPLLYLDRYYRQEQTIRQALIERGAGYPLIDPETVRRELDRLFPEPTGPHDPPDRQRVAAALAATHWTTVVAGGPGTGKTHTIARILALLVAHQRSMPGAPALRIALAAPTGKAAARLQESVREQAGDLDLPELTAATLHRLLGWQRGGATRFRHHEFNRLPYDIIVVDETSMVSLTMMSRLLPAVRPDARLVLVGDPDQLASVDAGAVLADLVAGPVAGQPNPVLDQVLDGNTGVEHPDALTPRERDRLRGGIVRLTRGRRFGGRIAALAVAVRAGDADAALALLADGGDELTLCEPDDITGVRADVVAAARAATAAADRGDAAAALTAMESHRLLCAHRQGQFGVDRWDRLAGGWVAAAGIGAEHGAGHWFPGQPLLVTANDHEARIYNGDTGVIVRAPDGTLRAALQRGSEPYLVHPTQFPGVTTVYAMTIHRSQGSQYGTVSVVLPGPDSTLLTRELLYTAITRARTHVRILGTEDAIRAGIARRVLRASGLRG
ncbi:exodeoxyribonuclease V subunit alpha [Nocardia terpenica]|uniref:exodeoxyribonuclease V subunit alpha n=1 Tax=Nocardia terpenica TaxID=455432 RepID=UPI001894BA9D|nr:exodeoxyribonuclease V subunit alpha [Nocardia terpenica]MBF6064345.1 exodeoxyribonuclease V subunit alpha [Nocardia terpenica]MBF6106678.1 exodeoxyribonuclease V subunit alpha [Nocardia terpenica]MBF6113963.1 exodeoxyribonuclease V subunit alpha [Nocardia terpenica]MBF6120413.1 exodeoxyribonuclease V subunit alpha [Nocardia terpenica]MBF6154930.1 exodeoxyribonuclease V subunit alpha [Nocardia terpenica]